MSLDDGQMTDDERKRRLLAGGLGLDPAADRAARERRAQAGRQFAENVSSYRDPQMVEAKKSDEPPAKMHLRDLDRRKRF